MTATAAVIGAGPAGLIAAEVLAAEGASVTVYDHKRSAGRKFLLAGRGGLNLTHTEPIDALLDRYGSARADLESAIRAFPPDDLREWCAELGEPTFAGTSGRVFPESFRATPLLRAWLQRLAGLDVQFEMEQRWLGWGERPDGSIDPSTHRFEDQTVSADVTVFALGGASWPRVGSDGGWVGAFNAAGIDLTPLRPSNCGLTVVWSEPFREKFAGSPIKNVSVEGIRGDIVITDSGLEGGPIYACSSEVGRRLEVSTDLGAHVEIDLFPDLDVARLADRSTKRRPKDSVSKWLRGAGFSAQAVGLLREATDNSVPADPTDLAGLAKALRVSVASTSSLERAISTSGGVRFDQLDADLMASALPGNFVAGEMLDWDAPTGGYLLQASFSTGVAAARGAQAWLNREPRGQVPL